MFNKLTNKVNKKNIFILFYLFFSMLHGQPIKNKFTHFTEQDGLSSNVVKCIMQDHLGYIWIGTGNGITKYDGYEFENFTVAPKDTNFLQLPLTTSLYEDSKGNIWIGSVGGVTKYDRSNNSFALFSFSQFAQKYNREFVIWDMKETKDGNILCCTVDFNYLDIKNSLFAIDAKSNVVKEINVVNDDSTKALGQISSLGNDKYLVSGVKGVAIYDYNKNIISWYPNEKQIIVPRFLQDGNDDLWLCTYNNGLIYFNLKDSTYKNFPVFNDLLKKLKYLTINKIIYDQKQNLYLATNQGLIYFDTKTKQLSISEINPQNLSALHSIYLNDILLDNSGSIWIVSEDAGVSKYDIVKNNFQAYTGKVDDKNSITPGWVSTMFEYNKNEIWLKSSVETIIKFNPKEETFKRESLPKNFELFHILRTSKGKILLAGSNGFYVVDPKKWEFTKLKLPIDLKDNLVFTAIEFDDKTIWFGTLTGLYIYDEINGAITNIDFNTLGIGNVASRQVNILIKDKNENIWIGTPSGLFKYKADTKLYSRVGFSKDPSKSLTVQDINSLYVDNDNNLWIGTWLGGLNKYDQKSETFESYTQKDGIRSHSVQGILGDEENSALWLSTFDGISRFDLKKKTFSNFGVDDGIHANQFADNSALRTSNGLFIFGGSNGITVFNPKEIQNNLIPPKVTITDFKLFNESILPGKNSPLEKPIYETKNLTLNYDENDLEFDYFASNYVDPQKNQYAYKLENYEDDWRNVGNQRSAIYPNLPPGNYIFHLKASNNNEVWNEEGVTLNIRILPPWWRTWWAYSLYIVGFVVLLGGVRKFELDRRREKENKKFLQLEYDRKSKELEEARNLQLSMLPKVLPQLPNLDIAVYMKTATEVGGDYYDFQVGLDGTLIVAIGDATGHGMKAGTIVSMVKALFASGGSRLDMKTYFDQSSDALKGIELGRLMMAFMMIKIKSNKIEIANAGMPPLYIYRKQSKVIEEILIKGMPLGAIKDFPYETRETEITPGDTLLLLSDGLPELQNEMNEHYGYSRIKEVFEKSAEKEPEEIINYFKNESSKWTNGKDPDDDVTFVVIKVK
jgi:serine phosphatase RsbU (regulator of sigma subunit)/ligand-binding sensor domain-containing protein